MNDLPPASSDSVDDQRPRERLLNYGPQALSETELIAILLRTGTAKEPVMQFAERILKSTGGMQGLAQQTPENLMQIKGLGGAKVAELLAAFELGRRVTARPVIERQVIDSARTAAAVVEDMAELSQEHVRVLLLDSSKRLQGVSTVYIGTLHASILRVAEVFQDAIKRNSAAIILAHNHPSGDSDPSPEDIEVTRTLVHAGKLLDIPVVDHLIIGHGKWSSLREMGLGF